MITQHNFTTSLARLRAIAETAEPGTSLSISDSNHLTTVLNYLTPLTAPDNERIQLLETALTTVIVNLYRAPERAASIAAFASAIMRGATVQEAIAEADKLEGLPPVVRSYGALRTEMERIADLSERWTDCLVSQINEIARAALVATVKPEDRLFLLCEFRDASRGHGRAGTSEQPDGPYMSMEDAANVYADLILGREQKS